MIFNLIYLVISLFSIKTSLATPIVGGEPVTRSNSSAFSKYPFMVSLQEKFVTSANGEQFYFKHFCGGTLLNSKWILSAGHCLWHKNVKTVFAIIGFENLKYVKPNERLAVDNVEFISFQPASLQNDIVLVRLLNPFVTAVHTTADSLYGKLPRYGMKAYRKRPCKIIGFGAKHQAGLAQEQLQEGQVFVISNKKCRRLMGYVWAPQRGGNTVCALGNGQDTCQGDSGGPLICKYDGTEYIYGIVSHGLTCGQNGTPSIYTVTGPYIEWISLVIRDQ